MAKGKLKDHRQIGQDLELFFTDELAPGAVFWLPKGMIIFKELEKYIRELTLKADYQETSTPILIKNEIFIKSGHWDKFGKHKMFNMAIYEDEEIKAGKVQAEPNYSLKPMNCPESTVLYRFKPRSYRELPLRFSEIGRLFRKEQSGEVNGLLRVRQFVMDDAHIYAREDQVKDEISTILDTIITFYKSLGFDYDFRIATRPEENFAGTKDDWKKAEQTLERILKDKKIKYIYKDGEGAFYGPKIDLHIQAINRDWQFATVQIDLYQPKAFGLKYVDGGGKSQQPAMIHRAIFGSFERFIAILTEHFQGSFPVWLSPVQAVVMPITDRNKEYTQSVFEKLKKLDIRVHLDNRSETLQAKIRDAQVQKIPYMLIVGDKEEKNGEVSLRLRTSEDLGSINPEAVIEKIRRAIEEKKDL